MAITINGSGDYATIQDAINAATSGQTVQVSAGTYAGFTLKDGVSVQGVDEAEVTITSAIVTPVTLSDVTVSGLTVVNGTSSDKLLDLSDTTTLTDVVFANVTFRLISDYNHNGIDPPIGNLQTPGITLIDGDDDDGFGLTFSNVTVDGGGHAVTASNSGGALVYTSVKGADMQLSGVTLVGGTDVNDNVVIVQWNMKTDYASPSGVSIIDSHTSEGGNFYVSGFDGVTIADNMFVGQGLALNGVKNALITGNTFQNIDDSIVSGGGQSRGLTIEDAWGTDGVSDISITGNTFLNITVEEGAIAFQRWGTGGDETATIAELNGVEIRGNTFTAVDTPIYFNPLSFGAGAAIPGDFAGSSLILGTSGTDDIEISDDAVISSVEGVWIVTEGGEATALFSIEAVTNDSGTQLLVGNGGFATIQAAIDAADAGDTIIIAEGDYAENLTIGKGLTLVGLGDVKIIPASGVAITIGGNVEGGDITLDGLMIDGGTKGVHVLQTANAGKLTVRDSDISGNTEHGIYVVGDDPDNDGSGPIVAGITAIEVIDTVFSNNGTKPSHNGSGNIKLFGFAGDALFQNVTITGADESVGQNDRPDYAIEITGYVNNGNANPVGAGAPNIGTVVFDNVVIDGAFHKNGVAIANFDGLDGLEIGGDNGGLDLSDVETNWGPVFNIDSITDPVIDASIYDIAFPEGPGIVAEIQGDTKNQDEVDQTITGTSSNDALMGKGGDDTLYGGDGDDTLYGADKPGNSQADDDGNDTLYGGAGDDTLYGGAGDDTLDGGAGDDVIDGGDGDDTILYTIGDGTDTIDGGAGDDALIVTGTAGNDTLDVVVVGSAITTIEGMNPTNINAYTFNGLGGVDTLSYAGTTQGVMVDLANGTATGFASISGVENVTGGSGSDILFGDGGNNALSGGAGDDTLNGGDGNDTLSGGAGNDTLVGGGGIDTAAYTTSLFTGNISFNGTAWVINSGFEGTDTLAGIERVSHGGVGEFLLVGGGGYANRTQAEAGMGPGDVLIFASKPGAVTNEVGGTAKIDEYSANGTNVGIDANAASDGAGGTITYSLTDNAGGRFAINAVTGVVTLANTDLINYAIATSHQITIRAENSLGAFTDKAFTIAVGEVLPTVSDLPKGGVEIDGTPGNDTFNGQGGNDILRGAGGDDDLSGKKGKDVIYGDAGDDALYGGKGKDTLYGGAGDDVLVGGKGKDVIYGGGGNDTASYADSAKKVNINLNKTKQKGGDAKGDKLYDIDNVIGSEKGDKLTGNKGDNILDGRGGNDKLDGKGGTDLLIGGKGKDTFVFKKGYGNDTIADFGKGDTIAISMKGINNFKQLKALMVEDDGDVVIDFGKGDTLVIADMTIGALGRGDFDL